ncbi:MULTISPECIES: signal peptidase I [Prochlorococcus]|uniref:signal peptidase I n=1 Tax=Prochlorococcus TaxID=1218 RepID=UPI0005339967|nr:MULTISPECIES: signal peptidase I [Prochlorococcus]KGG12302.1 Signal peptidase I [Prochlorococcus sp. MIT 0601]
MTSSNTNNTQIKKNGFISIVFWVLLALILRWQVIEPRWIPSGSMLPTLQIRDKILVEKVRPKIQGIYNENYPRGLIVVFRAPKALVDAGYENNSALIKRVVGIPGDKIEVHSGNLVRNGVVINEPWIKESIQYEMNQISVPADSYWVLGDNRNNSLDSHLWGALPKENIIGTAVFRYWPLQSFGSIRFSPSENQVTKDHYAIRS